MLLKLVWWKWKKTKQNKNQLWSLKGETKCSLIISLSIKPAYPRASEIQEIDTFVDLNGNAETVRRKLALKLAAHLVLLAFGKKNMFQNYLKRLSEMCTRIAEEWCVHLSRGKMSQTDFPKGDNWTNRRYCTATGILLKQCHVFVAWLSLGFYLYSLQKRMPRTTKKPCFVTGFANPCSYFQDFGGSFATRVSSSQLFDHLFVFGKWRTEPRELLGIRSLSPSIRDHSSCASRQQ